MLFERQEIDVLQIQVCYTKVEEEMMLKPESKDV